MKVVVARRIAAISAIGLAVVLPASVASASPARHHHHHHHTRRLAEVELSAFKVVVNAVRGPSNGGAPLATIRAVGFKKTSHGWDLVSRVRIGSHDGWFWFPASVCSISFDSGGHVLKVSLLVTPSIGCSATKTVRL